MINTEKKEAVYEDYPVLLTDITIDHMNQLVPLFERLKGKVSGLIIIADDVTGEVLENLSYAKENKLFQALAIKAPGLNKDKLEILEDIATLVNGKVIKKSVGDLSEVTLEDLGTVKKIISTEYDTVIIGDGKVDKRIKELKSLLNGSDTDERIKERIAKLIGGIAVLKIGGHTVVEQVEKQHKIEDALNATRCAMEDGVLPGGGIALFRASQRLGNDLTSKILKEALRAPIRQIAKNAGEDAGVIINKLINDYSLAEDGHDFVGGGYGSMFKFGIIDPYKVTKTLLEVVISGVSSLITTEKLIVNTAELTEEPS